jgi:hypothetical protein
MGYKAPKLPTQTSTFSLEPTRLAGEGLNINLSQQQDQTQTAPASTPAPTPEPTPEPTPTEPTYKYTDPGDVGYFGMKDYEELAGQGAPLSLIKEYAQKSPYGVGPEAARLLGMSSYTETQGKTTQFPVTSAQTIRYTDPGDKGYFGMQDYEELAGQGASMDLIKQYAQKSPMGVGPAAAARLGLPVTQNMPAAPAPAPRPAPAPSKPSYTYTDPGDKGAFGKMDYDELARQGVSTSEMRRIASGMQVGDWARRVLGL